MVTANDIAARRRLRREIALASRWALPLVGGTVWAVLMSALFLSLMTVLPNARGLRTPISLFAHPAMMFASYFPRVEHEWGPALLGYYLVLTCVAWNAPRHGRWYWWAAVLYGLHLLLNFVCTVLSADSYAAVPGTPPRTWGDLKMLLELGQAAPARLAALGALLLTWHMFVWWRLWLGWHCRTYADAPFNHEIRSATDGSRE